VLWPQQFPREFQISPTPSGTARTPKVVSGSCKMGNDVYRLTYPHFSHCIANCVFKDDGSNCSIFSFDINANKSRLPLARNALKKLRTLRHPGVIKVLDTAEVGYSRDAMHRGSYENICRQKRPYILLQRGSHH
jgi:hypothetical protein